MKEPKKINLSNIPTPIEKITFNGCSFLIKRDDYTGTELSGNKVRKLDYLLYEAIQNKSEYIFTCGGDQSNHARAAAVAAAKLGLKSKLFLWGNKKNSPDGNLLLDQFSGAEIIYLTKREYSEVNKIMLEQSKRLKKKITIVPTGGSNFLGIWGYINFVRELSTQLNLKSISGIVTAAGSGGTSAGILVGLSLMGFRKKVYAVNVVDDERTTRKIILDLAEGAVEKYRLPVKVHSEDLTILDGYSKEGYKKISPEKVKLLKQLAIQSGIILDPAYTGKAFYAFNEKFLSGRNKTDILFVHTGGIFGVFPKKKNYISA